MDQRRTRMRRRPSDQACGAGLGFVSHLVLAVIANPVAARGEAGAVLLKSGKPRPLSMP